MNGYEHIKNAVEVISGVKDLSTKNRKRYIADVRFVYMKLCREFDAGRFHVTNCGRCIGRDHGTVLHGLKEIEINLGKPWFLANQVYYDSLEYLRDTVDIDRTLVEDEIYNCVKRAMSLMRAVDKQVIYEDEMQSFINRVYTDSANHIETKHELVT